MKRSEWLAVIVFAIAIAPFAEAQVAHASRSAALRTAFQQLTRASQWRQVAALPLKFNTHHPQGLVKIGETFYLSSVEVTQPTKRYVQPQNGFDRDAGAGIGHLFKFDNQGNLITDLPVGEGTIYHPGGIDYDGQSIWLPVAEYRPHSRSIVYRVNPTTMKATEVFRYGDHLGGIVHDTDNHTLHAVSWGSRTFYRWRFDARGRVLKPSHQTNPAFYIDYQDCKYVGGHAMLCAGLSQYQYNQGGKFSLGGMEMIDLRTLRPIRQLPIELWTASGLPMTQNPFWIEATANGLRVYFVPEDRQSTLYVYDVK